MSMHTPIYSTSDNMSYRQTLRHKPDHFKAGTIGKCAPKWQNLHLTQVIHSYLIELSIFTPHSIRGASTSNVVPSITLDTIVQTTG